METANNTKKAKSKINKKNNMVSLRISLETKKVIFSILQKANKKDFGRKLHPDALIAKSLTLIDQKHIEELQETTMNNSDRFERKFKQYSSQFGTISKDEFLGILLKGGISNSSFEEPCDKSKNGNLLANENE